MKLSPHFDSKEFECRCCGALPAGGMDPALIVLLEDIRANFAPCAVTITSGYRCADHNKKVGGAKSSQHMDGTAADIRVFRDGTPIPPAKVADYVEKLHPDKYGVGRYKGWTHVDTRVRPARWSS